MKYTLSFGFINLISDNIAELMIDEGVVMSLEMCEEYDEFLLNYFEGPFAVLVNKIHNYTFTYEASLHVASVENLKAVAVITYDQLNLDKARDLLERRKHDELNVKNFSGLHMGRNKAIEWLEEELSKVKVN